MFGLLGPDAWLSHCTDLTEADIATLVKTGTSVVHNPSAIAAVRGYCPAIAMMDAGVTVMLGSDGTAPDRSTDMFRHMFQAMRYHQRAARDEALLPPGKALEMITIDAAKRPRHGGSRSAAWKSGKQADIITVDLHRAAHAAVQHAGASRGVFRQWPRRARRGGGRRDPDARRAWCRMWTRPRCARTPTARRRRCWRRPACPPWWPRIRAGAARVAAEAAPDNTGG